MADLTATAAKVAPAYPSECRIRGRLAAVDITAGQSVYYTSAGKAGLCQANSAGKEQFRGVALDTVKAGQTLGVLEHGWATGYDLSGLAYDAIVYQGDTAGVLADAASGTKTVRAGRVDFLNDVGTLTKILRVYENPAANW